MSDVELLDKLCAATTDLCDYSGNGEAMLGSILEEQSAAYEELAGRLAIGRAAVEQFAAYREREPQFGMLLSTCMAPHDIRCSRTLIGCRLGSVNISSAPRQTILLLDLSRLYLTPGIG